jgi:Flp pilus assembly protein TadG
MVELALILPMLLFMALAIFDFARVYVSAISVESAAREGADYGSLYPWWWTPANTDATRAEIERRACTAASTLTDYEGAADNSTCTNPTVDIALDFGPAGVTPGECWDVERDATPCRVVVTLQYEFRTILPLSLQFGDTRLGIPSEVLLERSSTFAISDFELDAPLEPSP